MGKNSSSLEKRIPLRSKLDTAKMLEAAGKYVKFLEAQVHLLKSMPNGLGSAGTLNPPTKSMPNGLGSAGMSSRYTTTKALVNGRKISSIILMKSGRSIFQTKGHDQPFKKALL
jgi:hypothetical protein